MPLSIISLILFGGGSMIYFMILILRYKKWKDKRFFKEINEFSLTKFKQKYFFWDLFDSLRKTTFSVLQVFFTAMTLMTFGILVIFIGLLSHFHFVPYKRKFHNLMEYFVLMATLLTLFSGLLFYVDALPGRLFPIYLKYILITITMIIIIASNILVVIMFCYDVFLRRKKEKKNMKKKLKDMKNILENIHFILVEKILKKKKNKKKN